MVADRRSSPSDSDADSRNVRIRIQKTIRPKNVARRLLHVDALEYVSDPGSLAQTVEPDGGQEPTHDG